MRTKVFVFIFTGEFGYELLNWQGKVRSFAETHPEITCVTAGASATQILYSDYSDFIPLNPLPCFSDGIADTYFLRKNGFNHDGIADVTYAYFRRKTISNYVSLILNIDKKHLKFIFSDVVTFIDGIQFGATRWAPRAIPFRKRKFQEIYDSLPFNENSYRKLTPSLEALTTAKELLSRIGIKEGFISIQTADRETFLKKRRAEPTNLSIFEDFMDSFPTVEIRIAKTRTTDTDSSIHNNSRVVVCRSLDEQLAVITFSSFCVFFSTGDFRSLHYVPGLIGKDVFSVVSSSIVSNSAINLWNSQIYKFGGKIIPITLESLLYDLNFKKSFFNYLRSRI